VSYRSSNSNSGNRAAEEVPIHVGKFEFYDQSGAEKPDS
jgi:hypothetical protein